MAGKPPPCSFLHPLSMMCPLCGSRVCSSPITRFELKGVPHSIVGVLFCLIDCWFVSTLALPLSHEFDGCGLILYSNSRRFLCLSFHLYQTWYCLVISIVEIVSIMASIVMGVAFCLSRRDWKYGIFHSRSV